MNNKTYLYSYLISLMGGVSLILLRNRANLFTAIAMLVGVLFLLPGLLAFIRAAFPPKRARLAGVKPSVPMIIVSGAAMIFGIVLIATPHTFIHLMVYLFGALLIVCGIMQIANFLPSMRSLGFPWWYLATPALCLAIGVVIIIAGAGKILDMLALITGIVLVVYSLNGLSGYYERTKRVRHGGVTGRVVNIE